MNSAKILTVNDYQKYFEELYCDLNSERDWEDIYGYLARTTGYLTRGLIKKNYDPQLFSRPLSWMFALASKLDISVQDGFYKKFPGVCHYCIENVCCCFRTDKQPLKDIPAYKMIEERGMKYNLIKDSKEIKNLNHAVKNISKIYPNNEIVWHFSGPWMNCAKLFEEIAELHESICKFKIKEKSKENVEEEFADIFSWILSAWFSSNRDKNLDDALKDYFYKGCPVCEKNKCECDSNDSRIQGIVDAKKFKEIRILFEELNLLTDKPHDEIKEIIDSLKSVEDSQNESVANTTISRANSLMSSTRNKLDLTEDVSKKIASTTKSIMTLLSFLS